MSVRLHLRLLALLTGILALVMNPVRAADADAVKEKLFQAKKKYDEEVQKFKKAVTEQLDKREEDARKAGNKKIVDQIKAERDAFEKSGVLPQVVPAPIREPMAAARTKLDKAYTVAVKEYLILKLDDAAGASEKEQQEFRQSATLMFGKRTYLVTLNHFDVKVDSFWGFSNNGTKDGTVKVKFNGELIPHSICFVPLTKGVGQVSYPLGGKWTVFQGSVGVPKTEDKAENPASPLTFEVIGDGRSLWKSESVTMINTFQKFTINVDKIKTLTLRVHCSDASNWAWSFWIEPVLIE